MEPFTTHRRNKPSDVGFADDSYALAAFPPARRGHTLIASGRTRMCASPARREAPASMASVLAF